MTQLGIGAMVGLLAGGDETAHAMQQAQQLTISSVALVDDRLQLSFEGGAQLEIWDDGQSCCETRYMRTDDDLVTFAGAKFVGAELKDAPSVPDPNEWVEHDVQFLEIQTDRGVFTMASHNEHNGYYAGFMVRARFHAVD